MWRLFVPTLRCAVSSATGAPISTANSRSRNSPGGYGVIPILVAVCLTAASTLYAQSNTRLKGYVFDRDEGTPLFGAIVELAGTNYKAETDHFGRFLLEDIPPGEYTIRVSAPGYQDFFQNDVKIVSDASRQINVRMAPKLYYIGKITVQEKRSISGGNKIEVLFKDDIERAGAHNLPELLENVQGIYVQRTGGIAGDSRVRIRGGDPKHVLILIDGQKINPSGSGVADLSSIPIEMIERVEIYKGGTSAEFGPDALGGVINIITQRILTSHNLSAEAEKVWGDWKTELYRLSLADFIPSDNFSSKFSYSLRKSAGDFDYSSYEVKPNPLNDTVFAGTQINNSTEAYNYFSSGIYRFNDRLQVTYSGQYFHKESGLPGRVIEQNESASSDDKRQLINSSLRYEGSIAHGLRLNLGFSRFEQHFRDRESVYRFDSKYTNDIFTLKHTQRHLIWPGNQIRFGTELRRDILYHTDMERPQLSMGKTVRDNLGLFVGDEQHLDMSGFFLIDNIAFNVAFRFDYTRTQKDSTSWQDTVKTNSVEYWSPKLGMAVSAGSDFSYVVRANYGKSFRLPSINALFWKGDARSQGNPGLKPEESEHSEAGLELNGILGPVNLSGGITYFHSFVRGLVIWQPAGGVWKPVNLDKAQITGHEDYVKISFLDETFSVLYQNTTSTSLNKSSGHTVHNKRLVFSPHYVRFVSARLDYKFLSASYSIRMVDSAFILPANTKYYDSYRVDDLRLGLRFDIGGRWQISTDYELHNVQNESYVLIAGYPMPGREWNFGLEIRYGVSGSD